MKSLIFSLLLLTFAGIVNTYSQTYSSTFGQRKKVILPDKSVAILNSHSSFRFSETSKQRNIILDGDVYFDIEKSSKPLIIKSSQLIITTNGAGLRVNAYADVSGEQADVLTGTAKIKKSYKSTLDNSTYTITRGEMIMINRGIDLIEEEKFDSLELKAWLGDKIVFKNVDLNMLIKKIESWYNIEVYTEGKTSSNLKYTGALHASNLHNILNVIGKSWQFRYRVGKKKIILQF